MISYDLSKVTRGKEVLSACRKGQKKKTYHLVLWSFLLPILALLPGFIYAGIAPFGNHTTMAVDLQHEYVGFYEAFRYALGHPDGFFYAMTKSLGGEMAGTFSYYMMSPWNLLFFLFPREALPAVIEMTQLLKIGLAGASFSLLLIHREHGDDWRVILFSTLYGLLSFSTANLLNHMWQDPILLFPLVILALERLLDGKNPLFYVLTLSLAIWTNYYIAYMGCIFLAMYTLYTLVRRTRPQTASRGQWVLFLGRRYLKFVFYSVLAAALCALLLLPTVYSILASKGTYAGNVVAGWVLDYPPGHFLAKLLPAAFDYDQVPSGLPNVFTGTITLLFSLFYFANRRISRRERCLSFLLLAFLILSMNIKQLTIFWHGMQYPIWYEYRFSWLFSFFTALLAFRSMRRIPRPANLWMLLATILYAGGWVYLYRNLEQFSFLTIYHLIAAAVVWVFLLLLLCLRPVRRPAVALALIGISFLEMSTNAAFHTGCFSYETWNEFLLFENQIGPQIMAVRPQEGEFWRVEKTFMHDNNDGMRFWTPGLSHFNSAMERENIDLLASLGFATTQNSANGTNGTKITDAIFGIRYYLDANPQALQLKAPGIQRLKPKSHRPDLADMTPVNETQYVRVYENPNAMPLGMVAEAGLATLKSNRANPADYQDWILNVLDGKPQEVNYLRRLPLQKVTLENCEESGASSMSDETTTYHQVDKNKPARIHFHFTAEAGSSHYLSVSHLLTSKNSTLLLDNQPLENKRVGTHKSSQIYNVTSVESAPREHVFTVEMKKTDTLVISNISLFQLDEAALKDAVNFQKERGLHLSERTNTKIVGTVRATKETPYLLLSLPYSKGWTALVDGKQVPVQPMMEQLMGIELSPGEHTIQWNYTLPGWDLGWKISAGAGGLALLLGLCHALRGRKQKKSTPQTGSTTKNEKNTSEDFHETKTTATDV